MTVALGYTAAVFLVLCFGVAYTLAEPLTGHPALFTVLAFGVPTAVAYTLFMLLLPTTAPAAAAHLPPTIRSLDPWT